MRTKRPLYTCPVCGYSSDRKGNMQKHLYEIKKQCPKLLSDIELTDDIKTYILENRIYRLPEKKKEKDPQTVINQTINNYNQLNAFVTSMDPIEKLACITQHENTPLIDFYEKIDQMYLVDGVALDEDKIDRFELTMDDFLDAVNKVSKCSCPNFADFSIYFNKVNNTIDLHEDQKWEQYLSDKGIRKVIETIQDVYFNRYECYLIRKILKHVNLRYRQRCEELIDDYYSFIACFDVPPYAMGHTDDDILGYGHRQSDTMEERFYFGVYKRTESKVTTTHKNKVRLKVLEVIKRNTLKNVLDMNKYMMNVMQQSPDFKTKVLAIDNL